VTASQIALENYVKRISLTKKTILNKPQGGAETTTVLAQGTEYKSLSVSVVVDNAGFRAYSMLSRHYPRYSGPVLSWKLTGFQLLKRYPNGRSLTLLIHPFEKEIDLHFGQQWIRLHLVKSVPLDMLEPKRNGSQSTLFYVGMTMLTKVGQIQSQESSCSPFEQHTPLVWFEEARLEARAWDLSLFIAAWVSLLK
jgi:hypothetical protein